MYKVATNSSAAVA